MLNGKVLRNQPHTCAKGVNNRLETHYGEPILKLEEGERRLVGVGPLKVFVRCVNLAMFTDTTDGKKRHEGNLIVTA